MTWDGLNRRKFPRIFFPCLIKVRNSDDLLLTHTENISAGGVRLILKHQIALKVVINIEIDLMDAGEPLRCKGKVVWSEQRKKSETLKPLFYDIGVEFMDVSAEDARRLDAVVAHHLKQGKIVR
jgi:c-di-GMP-binding flagellar brake protein YcgR